MEPGHRPGVGQYNNKVLVGNWHEDALSKEQKERDAKDSIGNRVVDEISRKTAAGRAEHELTCSNDGIVHFGDKLSVKHISTKQRLAVDENEKLFPVLQRSSEFQASGSPTLALRNTFVLQSADFELGEPVCFGNEILLCCDPSLEHDDSSSLWLVSFSKGLVGISNASKQQEVRIAKLEKPFSHAATKWRVEPVHSKAVDVTAGRPVRIGEPIQLVHCQTGQSLAMDKAFPVFNNYGRELEVFCTLHHDTKRVHVLKAENAGVRVGQDKVTVQEQNQWAFEDGPRV